MQVTINENLKYELSQFDVKNNINGSARKTSNYFLSFGWGYDKNNSDEGLNLLIVVELKIQNEFFESVGSIETRTMFKIFNQNQIDSGDAFYLITCALSQAQSACDREIKNTLSANITFPLPSIGETIRQIEDTL